MKKTRLFAAAGIAALLAGMAVSSPARAALTEDMFQARTTDDLVALCTAPATDPLYTPAQNFCHGFAVGTYQVIQEIQTADPRLRLFCMPEPAPARTAAIGDFVAWTKAHPDQGSRLPAESVTAFLADHYPCPKTAPARSTPRRTTP